MVQPRKKSTNHMATKAWLITGAPRGMGAEIAKAALVDGNQVVAAGRKPEAVTKPQAALAALMPIKGKSRNFLTTARTWLRDVSTPGSIRDVDPRCLPSVVFTSTGPLVYQWQFDRSTARDR
jgi:NAD(P)-dependent dehydrogenase (short-subunit alcohol dehydrogenase family)